MAKKKKQKILKEFEDRFNESIKICATDDFLEQLEKKYQKDKKQNNEKK